MADAFAKKRLRKEFMSFLKAPVNNLCVAPLEENILVWHYVLIGTSGSPYEGGYYHGKLTFPTDYPWKPPSIMMITPNGRFEVNKRICMTNSDHHPESWSPAWSPISILIGLYSFMLEDHKTVGSISTTLEEKRAYAKDSLRFNCQDKVFQELFPELILLYDELQTASSEQVDNQ